MTDHDYFMLSLILVIVLSNIHFFNRREILVIVLSNIHFFNRREIEHLTKITLTKIGSIFEVHDNQK